MKATVRGHFKIVDRLGVNRTPRGSKERALIVLLLFSPERRRSRTWIMDRLWSDRTFRQASVSLRQTLSKIRRDLGPDSEILGANRDSVWLSSVISIDESSVADGSEFLEDLDIKDPEFENWLRDMRHLRYGRGKEYETQPKTVTHKKPMVAILQFATGPAIEGRFLTQSLAGRIADALRTAGDVVIDMSATTHLFEQGGQNASICIETLEDAHFWYANLRVLAHPGSRCVWTGRLRLPLRIGSIWESIETIQMCNRIANVVLDVVIQTCPKSPYGAIQRAVRRVDDFDRVGLEQADYLLTGAQSGDTIGIALAWRAFIRLVKSLEYRETDNAHREEALAMHEEALKVGRDNPVVLALSAQVQMKLFGDFDYSNFLARSAVQAGDQNPYALNMMSHHLVLQGNPEQGRVYADAARRAATGLPNSFTFDIQGAFAALGLGQYADACELALICHRKKPFYRPALRYLVGLNLLLGRETEAQHHAKKLRQLEPDFTPALLLDPAYPFETFRRLGLLELIRPLSG